MKQAIRMMDLEVSRYSFRTQAPFVDGKVVTRLHAHNVIVFDQQIHTALHRAIRTVSGHDAIDHAISTPTIMRRVMQMRTIRLDDLFQMFDSTHDLLVLPVNP